MKKIWPFLLIILIVVLVFQKVRTFDYVWFDDDLLIQPDYDILKNLNNLPTLFTQDVFLSSGTLSNYYRPMLSLSFMIDAQRCGAALPCYHVTNLILHIIASFFVYLFLKKLGIDWVKSMLLALILAVHPVSAAIVGWVPGRNDSLFTIFFLASFLFLMDDNVPGHILFFLYARIHR